MRRPERSQVEMRTLSLEQMLPPDHAARVVWDYVKELDVTPLLASIRSTAGHAGQPANDPRILLALWLLATLDGVGSARELDRLCALHTAYQWLCGGVSMNYHTLADFRTEHVDFLNELLTRSVAVLLEQALVALNRVAQDGMRVRASAGQASFRRRPTLARCLVEAKAQVEALQSQTDEDDGAASRRQEAARERAARERQERLTSALRHAEQIAQRQQEVQRSHGVRAEPDKIRVSTTDPEARRMKMADGGFRPGYNVQFAATTDGGVIVGVDVTNAGADGGQMAPMVEQLHTRYGSAPEEMLVDGGFATLEDIQSVHERHQTRTYAPIKDEEKKRSQGIDPFAARPRDPEGVAAWRLRMGTDEAKAIYPQRASTAEWVNAGARNRDLYQVRVRSRTKVLAVVLWHALVHNLLRAGALRRAAEKREMGPAGGN